MAIDFRVQGIDFSGIGQNIAQGLQQIYETKRRENELVEQRLNDFQKNYNPAKLRAQDLPAFTTAFDKYKQAALQYSRLNRGGAKPAEIAVANEIKDRTLNEMNDLYSKSAMANQFLAERVDYRKTMAQRGYETPDEVNQQILQLSTSPANEIDFKSLRSPYEMDIKPNAKDMAMVSTAFKALPKSLEEEQEEEENYTIPGVGTAKVIVKGKYKKANFEDALNIAQMQLANPKVANYVKDDYEDLIQGFNLPDDVADPQLAILKKNADNTIADIMAKTGKQFNSVEEITPALLLAYKMGGFSKQRMGSVIDKTALTTAFKNAGLKLTAQRLAETMKSNKNIQAAREVSQANAATRIGIAKEGLALRKKKASGFAAALAEKRKAKKQ